MSDDVEVRWDRLTAPALRDAATENTVGLRLAHQRDHAGDRLGATLRARDRAELGGADSDDT